MAEAIEMQYYRFEPYIRSGLQSIILTEFHAHNNSNSETVQKEYFIAFYNQRRIEKIRSMKTDKIGKLVSMGGTVTRSSEVKPELLYGHFICKKCQTVNPSVEQHFQYTTPHVCKSTACNGNDYQLILDQSAYVDWQRLRVQENPDEIPAGSMPRSIDVICRNEVVEAAKAGDKVVFTGTVVVVPDAAGSSRLGDTTVSGKTTGRGESNGEGVGGLKRLGVREMTYRIMFLACSVVPLDQNNRPARMEHIVDEIYRDPNSHQGDSNTSILDIKAQLDTPERFELMEMTRTPHLYAKMVESICPSVFGHHEVKRGILLMLFGGVHKNTPEGISLRGDINVCIVGDPSCAKSQFLKYVHGFLPHTVYTSGKSSSAAGLTASVVRDPETGEHCIEAGALMLADNGICCIDEVCI